MNRHASGCLVTLLALSAVWAACAPLAAAQSLRDPTRPPGVFGRTGEGGNVSRGRDAEWVLQSVLLSPERRYAIINGEVLSLGGSVAGAELIAIREGEVTLRAEGVLRTVRLFPDVDMRSEAVPKSQHPQQDWARPRAREKSQAGAAEDAR